MVIRAVRIELNIYVELLIEYSTDTGSAC